MMGKQKVINDSRFWHLIDLYESGNKTKTEACIVIGEEYQKLGCKDLDQAFADVNLLLKGKATKRQYNYLKKVYFK